MKQAKALKMKPNSHSLSEVALRYKLLKAQEDQLAAVISSLKAELERAIEQQGSNGVLHLEDFTLKVSACERENFSLKSARETIPSEVLQPFVSVTSYTRLTVNERGTGKIAA